MPEPEKSERSEKYPDQPDYGDEQGDIALGPEMSDAETAAWIRTWCAASRNRFSWPTDPCGYEQHIKFVKQWNDRQRQGDFVAFARAYADTLDPPKETGGNQSSEAKRAVTPSASEALKSTPSNGSDLP